MLSKVREKDRAIELRKTGLTYNEILREVMVARSSLSLWLKDLPLTESEKRYLKTRKDSIISRGRIKAATSNRNNRLNREKLYLEEAKNEFYSNQNDSLFLVGISLYWAEGAKRSTSFQFMNSDPEMIELFIKWIEKFVDLSRNDLGYRLFMHKIYDYENCEQFWANYIMVSEKTFKKTTYKLNKALVKRRPNYKGCLRIEIPRSTKLLFKMKVWQNMLARKY